MKFRFPKFPKVPVWIPVAVAAVIKAAGVMIFKRDDFIDYEDDYTTRTLQNGTWKCPDGYTDTGKGWEDGAEEGKKQCRRMATGKKAKLLELAQRKARKKCGKKPETDGDCQLWKCKKYGQNAKGGGREWVCALGKDNRMSNPTRKAKNAYDKATAMANKGRELAEQAKQRADAARMGCSTDGNQWDEVMLIGDTCHTIIQGKSGNTRAPCKCCEGPPNVNGGPEARGYMTCPGRGKCDRDGC